MCRAHPNPNPNPNPNPDLTVTVTLTLTRYVHGVEGIIAKIGTGTAPSVFEFYSMESVRLHRVSPRANPNPDPNNPYPTPNAPFP